VKITVRGDFVRYPSPACVSNTMAFALLAPHKTDGRASALGYFVARSRGSDATV